MLQQGDIKDALRSTNELLKYFRENDDYEMVERLESNVMLYMDELRNGLHESDLTEAATQSHDELNDADRQYRKLCRGEVVEVKFQIGRAHV